MRTASFLGFLLPAVVVEVVVAVFSKSLMLKLWEHRIRKHQLDEHMKMHLWKNSERQRRMPSIFQDYNLPIS